MQPKKLKALVKIPSVSEQPALQSLLSNSKGFDWGIRRLNSHWRINQKIGYGYALAIGIAILGTTVGVSVGNYYHRQAKTQVYYAHSQERLLSELQYTLLAARSHQQRVVPAIGNSARVEYEISGFFENMARVKALLSELEAFTNTYPGASTVNASELKDVLKTYAITIESYAQLIVYLLKEINPVNLKPNEISTAQQLLLTSISGEVAIKFDILSERLSKIVKAAKAQEISAQVKLEQADALELKIVIASMLLSAASAIMLAIYTSRAIARPLEKVTKVAQQVTQESNFNLRVPVTSTDEVGALTISLNQLIQWVDTYTSELKQTQSQLIQTEKMSSLGQLVAGVAHEINNPVNFINGNIEYAAKYTQNLLKLIELFKQQYPNLTPVIQEEMEAIEFDFISEDLPKLLSSMKIGAERIRDIVLSLRNFSRLDESEMKQSDIHEGIDSTLLILNHRIKNKVEVIKHYGDLPQVECYPAQLNQVFMNILSNAIDELEESFGILKYSKNEHKEDLLPKQEKTPVPIIKIFTEKLDFAHVKVRIVDNGSGIPPEVQGKLFDPFFTTKAVGKGTGLGLAICYRIIEKHQGKIEVKSRVGAGTEFAITLPIFATSSSRKKNRNGLHYTN
ncbi:MAG: HAMP domain-containing protein [Microcoleus vaginatus WJT46-NPBG5]|nr:HAMP domain-containing protein [Microcoleus vaginatus WJT46-NPBG5]